MSDKEPALKAGSYLVFADHKFAIDARAELTKMFGNACTCGASGKDDRFFVASIRDSRADALSRIKRARPTFIDAVVPVYAMLRGTGKVLLTAAVAKLLDKKRTFKIEAAKMGTSLQGKGRDLEVGIGNALEKHGFKADIRDPDRRIYLVLLKGRTVIGRMDRGQALNSVLDKYRESQASAAEGINRAESKLKEALEFFDMDLSGAKRALDIGAAPGGWTHALLGKGAKVVAVDSALLDYGRIGGKYSILVLADAKGRNAVRKAVGKARNVKVIDMEKRSGTERYDVVHIKSSAQKSARLLGKMGKFGILVIDTNSSVTDSAGIAMSLAGTLDRGAYLIMTLKLFHKNTRVAISSARRALRGSYRVIGVKKLPHNRDELTLCARKRKR